MIVTKKRIAVLAISLFSLVLIFLFFKSERTTPEETISKMKSLEKFGEKMIDSHADFKASKAAKIVTIKKEDINSGVNEQHQTPLMSPIIDQRTESVVNDLVDKIKQIIGDNSTFNDNKYSDLIKNKFLLESESILRLNELFNGRPELQNLVMMDDSQLNDEQIVERDYLRSEIEKILDKKRSMRSDFENSLLDNLTAEQVESLQSESDSIANKAAQVYVNVLEENLNGYVSDLNEFQIEELSKLFARYREKKIVGTGISTMFSKYGPRLDNDDPVSMEFMSSLQNDVNTILSEQQLLSMINGIRSQTREAQPKLKVQ